ncbi:MAG: chromosome segregation protein SMC [Candidatus Koribacter versatilis]|uniref:Chromosome partition protein Smc n=1 Tax=Candidatus Korobacter versatilis TaxID=658062 RepID=A0A932A6V3_9BACT|nr:chromosome segregation protein SMC [Candidatus Koribacter versatilis]
MLKLKKLQVLGFKSFCDRTELKFHGEGMAAIVGPNGCGKSNIADAISWVLGEQSAKSLRGARMEDVIFAGTRDRKPMGMAEVSLTLIDPEVFEGADLTSATEVDVQADLPDDWDEAHLRTASQESAEQYIEEVQPNPEESADAEDSPVETGDSPSPADATENPSAVVPGVVLKIRRRKFAAQEKRGQIVVTRRLFRTGDSEYLINGKLARLRDIQEIFMGTGLGPESYAIIEQGRIGQILSSKPHDRRAIIEEAAGITKFKTKKRLAEARLEEAKLNLSRVNDIFEEVTRQMNSLKRQSSKAERYAKLRDEMREKLRLVLASKYAELEQQSAQFEAGLAALTAELHSRTAEVERLEADHSAANQRTYALQSETQQNAHRASEITLEADRAAAQRKHNDERCSELEVRIGASQSELERNNAQLATLSTELAANQAIVESAASGVAAARAEAELAEQRARSAAETLVSVERTQDQRRGQIMELVAQLSGVRNQITQAAENIAALDREAQRLAREAAAANAEIEQLGSRRSQLSIEFESATTRVNKLAATVADARRAIEEKRAAETAGKQRLDGLRAEFASALGKRNSLESVIAEHGYSTESVKRLFQSGIIDQGFRPVGVLADFLEVEGKYEGVVEDFLRDELNYVVVKSWDAADAGLEMLRTGVDGRATFLVHPSDSQARFSFAVDGSRGTPRGSMPPTQPIVPLKSCIKVLNGFGKSLEVILPKLGNGYITADAGIARDLALDNPDAFFLAASGECFHNVTVTGGKQRAEGPLSMKRELREVEKQLNELERAVREDELKVATLGREIAELTTLLDHLEEERREADKLALTAGHSLEQMSTDLGKTDSRLAIFRAEMARVEADRAEKQSFVAGREAHVQTLDTARIQAEAELATAQASLAGLNLARETAAHAASDRLAALAAMDERRKGAESSLQRIQALVQEVALRVNALTGQIAAAGSEREQRQQQNVQLAGQLVTLEAERAAVQERGVALQHESEQLRASLAAIEDQLKTMRAALDAARDRRGELSASAAKLTSDMEHMAESCLNELSLTIAALQADDTVLRVAGETLATEEAMYREMRARLEAMGPVNMMALEEYKETAERHAFLETQRNDLLESIENTQATIKEIDQISKEKFQEAFDRINENFQLSFRKLFGGGQAFMRLTDLENSAESGIDVVASPPGKKLQNVLLLSGGEKALTALSLLVGIFQYQPAPFCILDEVDAPLDETNVGRFNELVREMSAGTQFVLITHSKKTMSMAPVMYGVTMQEPGVSKVLSVKFGADQKDMKSGRPAAIGA